MRKQIGGHTFYVITVPEDEQENFCTQGIEDQVKKILKADVTLIYLLYLNTNENAKKVAKKFEDKYETIGFNLNPIVQLNIFLSSDARLTPRVSALLVAPERKIMELTKQNAGQESY